MLKLGINKSDNESYHKDRKFKSRTVLKEDEINAVVDILRKSIEE